MSEINSTISSLSAQLNQLNEIISRKDEIGGNFSKLSSLKKQENILSNKLMKFSELEKEIHILRDDINNQRNQLKLDLQNVVGEVSRLTEEKSDKEKIIKDKEKILDAYGKFLQAKECDRQQSAFPDYLDRSCLGLSKPSYNPKINKRGEK